MSSELSQKSGNYILLAFWYARAAKILLGDPQTPSTDYYKLAPTLFLLRHAIELFQKSIHIATNHLSDRNHNIEELSLSFKTILDGLNGEDISNAALALNDQGKTKISDNDLAIFLTKILPETIEKLAKKYSTHTYCSIKDARNDKENTSLRYPDDTELINRISELKKEEIATIAEDIDATILSITGFILMLGGHPDD